MNVYRSAPLGAEAQRRSCRGTTSLELLVAVAVLMTGILAFARTLAESAELEEQNMAVGSAILASRGVVERMAATEFDQIYAAFNSDQNDDVTVTGTVFGSGFAVDGLAPRAGDADGLAGEVVMPVLDVGGVLELREDIVDDTLGMPRDLNLDGVIDSLDHSADYQVLPVTIRIDWVDGRRNESFAFTTILGVR